MSAAGGPKVSCSEGSWVVVPLRNGGWGLGLVARRGGEGGLLGYFFGPRRTDRPVLDDVRGHRSEDAVTVAYFSEARIVDGTWPVLGTLPSWRREDWPVPDFGFRYRDEPPERRHFDDSLHWTGSERMTIEDYERLRLPDSAFFGTEAIELTLTRLLSAG